MCEISHLSKKIINHVKKKKKKSCEYTLSKYQISKICYVFFFFFFFLLLHLFPEFLFKHEKYILSCPQVCKKTKTVLFAIFMDTKVNYTHVKWTNMIYVINILLLCLLTVRHLHVACKKFNLYLSCNFPHKLSDKSNQLFWWHFISGHSAQISKIHSRNTFWYNFIMQCF